MQQQPDNIMDRLNRQALQRNCNQCKQLNFYQNNKDFCNNCQEIMGNDVGYKRN